MRLEFVGNTLILFSALFAVIAKENITAGVAGLSISYAMQVCTEDLIFCLHYFCRAYSHGQFFQLCQGDVFNGDPIFVSQLAFITMFSVLLFQCQAIISN